MFLFFKDINHDTRASWTLWKQPVALLCCEGTSGAALICPSSSIDAPSGLRFLVGQKGGVGDL